MLLRYYKTFKKKKKKKKFQVSLIEINLDPDLSHSTNITRNLIPIAIESLLQGVLDVERQENDNLWWTSGPLESN